MMPKTLSSTITHTQHIYTYIHVHKTVQHAYTHRSLYQYIYAHVMNTNRELTTTYNYLSTVLEMQNPLFSELGCNHLFHWVVIFGPLVWSIEW